MHSSRVKTKPSKSDRSTELEKIARLGAGSFGAVYRYRHKATGATVAVKIISNAGGDRNSEADKIMSEIDILAKCDSPFIVGYYYCFIKPPQTKIENPEMWIVMEFCEGGSMSDLIEAGENVSGFAMPEDCIRVVCASIVLGLEYLHGVASVCHRDIKCGNVLLSIDGHVKLADFGVSAELNNTIARRNTVVGSPFWMAPEVIQEKTYDGRADVWSLGITAIEMAEGKPPHARLDPYRAIFLIPSNPAPTLADPDNWSPEMLEFIRCCLHKDPSQRYDAARLTSHPFIKSEVIALRKVWRDYKSGIGSNTGAGRVAIQEVGKRPSGLPALRKFMDQMKKPVQQVIMERDQHLGADTLLHEREQFEYAIRQFENEGGSIIHDNSSITRQQIKPNDNMLAALKLITAGEEDSMNINESSFHIPSTSIYNGYHPTEGEQTFTNYSHLDGGNTIRPTHHGSNDSHDNVTSGGTGTSYTTMCLEKFHAPELANDALFQDEVQKLNHAFEKKLHTLRVAHELAQQQLIAEARLRNGMSVDVSALMEKAAQRSIVEKESIDVNQQAAECSFMKGSNNNINIDNSVSNELLISPTKEKHIHGTNRTPSINNNKNSTSSSMRSDSPNKNNESNADHIMNPSGIHLINNNYVGGQDGHSVKKKIDVINNKAINSRKNMTNKNISMSSFPSPNSAVLPSDETLGHL